MLHHRARAALKVAESLVALENAIDLAITRAGELTALLPAARVDARLSAIVGQDALDGASMTQSFLVQARRAVVDTHHRLDETREQIGLRPVAIGDGVDKPPLFSQVDGGVVSIAA
jgi:hypothetical protein